MNEPEVLVIDDESQIRKLLQITLQSNGFRTREAATAKEGLIMAANHPPDLILLDIGLPDENGQDVLQQLREWYNKSIIILSVQSDEVNIVQALDHGANDYLVKPFRTGELLARIRSSLRSNASDATNPIWSYGDLKIDLARRIITKADKNIKLTVTEYDLLALLVKNEGKVLTHQYMLRHVWGPSYVNQLQYLRVFVAQLRKKIENEPDEPELLLTEPGVGYRFVAKE